MITLYVLYAAVKPVLFTSAEMESDASSSVRNGIFMAQEAKGIVLSC